MGVRSGSAVRGDGLVRRTARTFFGEGYVGYATVRECLQSIRKHVRQPSQLFLRHPTGIRQLNDVHRNLLEWHLVSVHIGQRWESNMPVCRSEQGTNEMGKEMVIRTTR